MRNICIAISMLLILVTTGCSDQEQSENIIGIQKISYGTSFGECLGYCRKSITITPSEIEFTKQGWDIDEQLPDSSFQQPLSTEEWNSLVMGIDKDEFIALDSVIGCPDCADGGAEWVEIVFVEEPHKVTFEYFNTPEPITQYIDTLRSFMDSFE